MEICSRQLNSAEDSRLYTPTPILLHLNLSKLDRYTLIPILVHLNLPQLLNWYTLPEDNEFIYISYEIWSFGSWKMGGENKDVNRPTDICNKLGIPRQFNFWEGGLDEVAKKFQYQ